ncbi:hypothetical protein ACRZ5O_22705 [Pseudomonas protegens]
MTITVGSFDEIAEALRNQGFLFLVDVNWIKQPARVRGMWRCCVEVKA